MYILLLLYLFNYVTSHSAPSCTNKINEITCEGFPRYYHFNHLNTPLPSSDSTSQFYASRDRENVLQPGVNKLCPSMPIPEYTLDFPMASAYAGSTLTLQHPPRGHAQQPSSPVWIYIYNTPNVYNTTSELVQDNFSLLGQYSYSQCNGLEKEISWANCTGSIRLPDYLPSGIYTFWWRWDLNSIPYYDCFEINIKNNKMKNVNNTKKNCTCLN